MEKSKKIVDEFEEYEDTANTSDDNGGRDPIANIIVPCDICAERDREETDKVEKGDIGSRSLK